MKEPRHAKVKNGQAPRTCTVCHRPFEWRAKWRRDFENMQYCSTACSQEARRQRRATRS